MHGWVTDVCLKRKVRDYVHRVHDQDIYVKHRGILAREQRRAYARLNAPPSASVNYDARRKMCQLYYDVRMFGAVMTTGRSELRGKQWNCGQVRGPVQLSFARSVDPINPIDLAITRVALTNPDDVARGEVEDVEAVSGQMGRRFVVPYGLYVTRGAFNPFLADDTGASAEDLSLLWDALTNLWDLDRSVNRGTMTCRGLYVFTHSAKAGDAPAYTLVELVTARLRAPTPRRFQDYEVTVDDRALPPGISLARLVG